MLALRDVVVYPHMVIPLFVGREKSIKCLENSGWAGLEVINTAAGSHENEGFVEFKAYFNDGDSQFCMQERSRFVREGGLWYYIDGTFPEQEETTQPEVDPRLNQTVESFKIGRNDPCICGSGRKYKKCCG